MGTQQHHAIVVTTWRESITTDNGHTWVEVSFGELGSSIVDGSDLEPSTNAPTCPPTDASKSAAEMLADIDALIALLPPRPRLPPEAKRILFVDLARRLKRVRACSNKELAEMPSVRSGMSVEDYRLIAVQRQQRGQGRLPRRHDPLRANQSLQQAS